jgi:hypothetical protein
VEPFPTVEETARHLLGVQAQLIPAANLAFWNRTAHCTLEGLEHSRLRARNLVRFWGQRNTVHLYRTKDWPFLHTVFKERQSLLERRLDKAGLLADFRRLVNRTGKRLEQGEILTYKDIRSKKLEESQETWVVSYVVLMHLVRQGLACHGPDQGRESGFVHRQHWRPDIDWSPPEPGIAFPELALRYLTAYGPAEDRDLAFWCGTSLTNARRWLGEVRDECERIEMDGRVLWCRRVDVPELSVAPPPAGRWPVKLLHRFDPLLLATRDKSLLIDEAHYKKVWRPAAHVEPVLLVHGRIAGVWRYDRKAGGLQIQLSPFAPLGKAVHSAAKRQAANVAAFLKLPLTEFAVAPA